jgi:hypothetical protein
VLQKEDFDNVVQATSVKEPVQAYHLVPKVYRHTYDQPSRKNALITNFSGCSIKDHDENK